MVQEAKSINIDYGSIACLLKINPQSVVNWVNRHISKLLPAPIPNEAKKADLDEPDTFIDEKNNEIHALTIVDRGHPERLN